MMSGNYRMVVTLLQSFVNLFVSDELLNINVLIFLATLHYFNILETIDAVGTNGHKIFHVHILSIKFSN